MKTKLFLITALVIGCIEPDTLTGIALIGTTMIALLIGAVLTQENNP
jgi:hypothetical protein